MPYGKKPVLCLDDKEATKVKDWEVHKTSFRTCTLPENHLGTSGSYLLGAKGHFMQYSRLHRSLVHNGD